MNNTFSLVMLTILSCFTTINSMELTKTQPLLLQKLSALSKNSEVRRAVKIATIGAVVCAVAWKLLRSPEPALMTVHQQPAQATASTAAMQASSASASVVEISSDQRTVNKIYDFLLDKHSKASWADKGPIKTSLFTLLVLSNSLAVDRSGYTPWLSQQVNAKDALKQVIKKAQEEGLEKAVYRMGELMSKRGDSRSPFAYAYTRNLWKDDEPIISIEDRMIRDQLPRNTLQTS